MRTINPPEFESSDLDANRQGKLSKTQIQWLATAPSTVRNSLLALLLIGEIFIVGILFFSAISTQSERLYDNARQLFGYGLVATLFTAVLFGLSLWHTRRVLKKSLRIGSDVRVEAVQGTLFFERGQHSLTALLGGQRFKITPLLASRMTEGQAYIGYYLAGSDMLISAELVDTNRDPLMEKLKRDPLAQLVIGDDGEIHLGDESAPAAKRGIQAN
ncbi:MAG: hypothetical protein OHK0023_04090 [Anaerolineae bacterium]